MILFEQGEPSHHRLALRTPPKDERARGDRDEMNALSILDEIFRIMDDVGVEAHQRCQRYRLLHFCGANGLHDGGSETISLLFPLFNLLHEIRVILAISTNDKSGPGVI